MYDNDSHDRSPLEIILDRQPESKKRDKIRVMLYETINNLSLDLQNFLILCNGTTLTHAEIGTIFGCSQLQAHQEIKRARRNLLKNFAENAENIEIAENAASNSESLVRLKAIIEAELSTQIQHFFSDRIDGIYQSLAPEQKISLAASFFSQKDN